MQKLKRARTALAKRAPAFAVQAAKNILTTEDGTSLRQLRFSIGPRKTEKLPQDTLPRSGMVGRSRGRGGQASNVRRFALPARPSRPSLREGELVLETVSRETHETDLHDWEPCVKAIAESTNRPTFLIYAPVLPSIVDGYPVSIDTNAIEFERLKRSALERGVGVVDLRDDFLKSVSQGRWPHGFHNGQFGVGHLNVAGNQIVANAIVNAVKKEFTKSTQGSR